MNGDNTRRTRAEEDRRKGEGGGEEGGKEQMTVFNVFCHFEWILFNFVFSPFLCVLDSSHLSWLSQNCPFSCSCDERVCCTRSSAVRTGVLCVYLPAGWVPPDIVSAWHPSLCYDNDRENMMWARWPNEWHSTTFAVANAAADSGAQADSARGKWLLCAWN